MTRLTSHGFEQRVTHLWTRLDQLGVAQVAVSGRKHRKIDARVTAPGVLGQPELARFAYEEWFQTLADGTLLRTKYHYNYFDIAHGGWTGLHMHPLPSTPEVVAHAKCVGHDGSGDVAAHYEAYEVDLWAAHDQFERAYAAEEPITCRGLRRID